MNKLPPFPTDDATLDLLMAAIDPRGHGNPDAERSSVWSVLEMLSELGGSDPRAVAEVHDDGSDGGPQIVTMRDQSYHDNDALAALIKEVRTLRDQRNAVLAYLDNGNYGAMHELHDAIRNIYAGKEQT